jgi:hypothetical protein
LRPCEKKLDKAYNERLVLKNERKVI